jgi:hypothetical protein
MISLNDTVTLSAKKGFTSYKWNDEPYSQNNTIDIIASELGEGTFYYKIEVENSNGCVFTDTVKLIITSAVGVTNYSNIEFSAYPNPIASDELNIEYNIASDALLIIYSQDGKKVSTKALSKMNSGIKILLPQISGLYNLIIISSEGIGNLKVLKL